ncbi:asparagine--tRNA ligase [Tissierella creatinophila]|uniref:Asparagine--tRNA ligase n=1 Tax=Tissierella creatinophila DSM 6911 TaxID=1123403 RepID=A0A1U7M9D6_TISCR|nr:asparagine--tRNA ligase [Tissierella creatinophila]OLS03896.1 asparagine--tRNA ligase [Tissierella creatinophila DSM 6911]
MKTFVKDIYKTDEKYLEKEIILEGWVRNIRALKNFGFIELNDGTFFKGIQIVYSDELSNFAEIEKLHLSSSLRVKGILKPTPQGKQPFEIQATDIEVEGLSSSDYPLQKKKHTMEYLRTIAHLRPRSNTFSAVFRVRSIASYAIHKFFQERDFVYVNPPIITSSDAEGAGEMFRVSTLDYKKPPLDNEGSIDYKEDFFGKETFLTVSGQLEAEAYALSFKNIYTFGPTFRAENSNTSRHAAEFWMMEPEIAFADLKDNMNLAEKMMKYVISYVMDEAKEEMEFFNKFIDKDLLSRLENIVNSEFERITYTEAVEILKKSNKKFNYPVEWGIDLQTEHERYITEEVFKKPVFVTDYPKDIKAFYMRENDDNKTVAAMDLLVPGVGEIIGGSQREERLELLEQKIIDNGMNPEDYWWYLELRKYGGTKHAGFGLGFERLIMYITGMTNIRDVIPFPRTVNWAEF